MIPIARTVDVSPRGVQPRWELFAWILLSIILGGALLLLAYLRFQVYDAEQRRQLSAIRAGELRASPPTILIRQGFDADVPELICGGHGVPVSAPFVLESPASH